MACIFFLGFKRKGLFSSKSSNWHASPKLSVEFELQVVPGGFLKEILHLISLDLVLLDKGGGSTSIKIYCSVVH
jgi:hypothetical protein